ncbi:MAG TPA: hypothetical protein VMV10_11855 [Pirellulales bacterium]|nr:hypothetical protein [Pirellulales bacterium]
MLYLAKKGAAADVESRVKVPEIASISPDNDATDINFQSRWGVPLKPVVDKFRTRARDAK